MFQIGLHEQFCPKMTLHSLKLIFREFSVVFLSTNDAPWYSQKMIFYFFEKKIYVDFLSTNDAPQHPQKQNFEFHLDFLSTNDAPPYTRLVGFLSTIYR